MAIQICAYKLADVYLEKILDDSYNPQEISNLVERFMIDTKFNPNTDLLQNKFDKFASDDSGADSFTAYIENQKEEILSACDECDKKEIVQKVREWKDQMDKKVTEFKAQNSVTARALREEFLNALTKRIAEFVDLTLRKDEANKVNNEPRAVRGSIVRAQKFTKNLLDIYTDAAEKYRKQKDSTADCIKDAETEFKGKLDDLEKTVDSLLSTKKKISEDLESTLDACVSYLNTKRENLIAEWAYELLTGIKELGIVKYNGLIAELEAENQMLERGVTEFKAIQEEVKKYLFENKNYESNYLCDILFDYKDDVEGVYQALIAEKGEDLIFQTLSQSLKDKENAFGNSYENLKDLIRSQMLICILRATEEYFKEPIGKINITDKLLKNEEKLNLLLNGNYYNNASVYLGLDGGQLSQVGLNLDSSTFFAITIPDVYEARPCRAIKGVNGLGKRCPVDDDEEKYKGDNACPFYPNCLKKRILDNGRTNLAIVPTSETAEINVVTTVAGYPLHAVTTAIHDCKSLYEQQKRKNEEENRSRQIQEERLHMFGPIDFTDLTERSEDPLVLMKPFKKTVMFALALGRLVIRPLSVDFITKRDLDAGRRDNPSLHLGESIADIYKSFQSTRTEDQNAIKQITEEMKYVKDMVATNDEIKNSLAEKLKASFEELNKNPPAGITPADIDLIDEVAKELCGLELVQKPKDGGLW
jgi:predicted nucleic-acid-binding protein